jgi:hypothetical protein
MRLTLVIVCAALAAMTGCGSADVRWDEPVSASGDTLGGLIVRPTEAIDFVRPEAPVALPVDSARCVRTVAVAREGAQWYAAWFSLRSDSTVAVLAARSADSGKTWSRPGMVDSVDVAKLGCDRPGPSIAASSGYVHVAYSLEAPEGFGAFFAHSMDSTATFHSPITVIYGDRLSATAVAAAGMQVAVAYEEPSGHGHRIDVALSRTQGHTFEPRERGSPDEMTAVLPEVSLRDSIVALSFAQPDGGMRSVRIGHLR